MRHPLELIQTRRLDILITLLILTIFLMVLLSIVGAPLTTPTAPNGIISYELAGSVSKVDEIINSWDHNAQLHAAFSLGFDYLFLVVYSTTIAFACIWAGEQLRSSDWPLAGLGVLLAWGLWLAALLDAVENLALVIMLFGEVVSPWPELARWCAIFKFSLIFIGMVYALLGLIAYISGRFSGTKTRS